MGCTAQQSCNCPNMMKMERPHLLYNLVALDFLPPSHVQKIMTDLPHALALGAVKPLTSTVHGMNNVVQALRQMSRAAHIGKVVVSNQSFAPVLDQCHSSWVVTGGTGALGLLTGEHLTQHGIRNVLMLGRTGHLTSPHDGMSGQACGAEVQILHCDVSCAEDCELLGGLGLQGVMHAGGVLADSVLGNQTAQSVKRVFAPKVAGLHHLANTFAMDAMNVQVLFSSVAALLGSAGQANYAAANAVLDAQAHMWQSAGLGAVSVQWGPWASGGMAVKHAKRMEQAGLYMLSPQEGLFALQSIAGRVSGGGCLDSMTWSSSCAQVAVQRFMWGRFLSRMVNVPALFSNMQEEATGHDALLDTATKTDPSDGVVSGVVLDTEVLHKKVKEAVHAVVGHDVSPDDPLMAAGLDSLGAMELRSSLEQSLGVDLPGMLIFDYPSVHAILDYAEFLLAPACKGIAGDDLDRSSPIIGSESVTVFLDTLWCSHNFKVDVKCTDAIVRVPVSRWDNDAPFCMNDSFISGRFFGLLKDIEMFDKDAFSLLENEARIMDPQQRLLLGAAFTSVAQWTNFSRTTCGVYVGVGPNEFSSTTGPFCEQGVYTATSEAISVGSGRLSYTFGLQGPCMTIDTACSASLVASHLSIQGIKAYESSCSIAAGALVVVKNSCQRLQKAGMLSVDGRCKTLDASGDGYVRGEGCSLICLDANGNEMGNTIVLGGSAVNQDGRSSSLTAPNGPSQQKVISKALQAAVHETSSVALLQMHGTGTSLGDPIEISAAYTVLNSSKKGGSDGSVDPAFFFTVKSSIGHSEVAAGVMAIAHSVASIEMRKNFPFTHLRNLNPYVKDAVDHGEEQRKVKFPMQNSSIAGGWADSDDSLCGISSFAFQGTNAHLLMNMPSSTRVTGFKATLNTLKEERCTVIPMWKRMTGCALSDSFGTLQIQCVLSGHQLSELACSLSGRTVLSEWAPTTFAVESVNLVSKSAAFFLNELAITGRLTVEKEHLELSSLVLLDASIDVQHGSLSVLSGDECALVCEIKKDSLAGSKRTTRSPALEPNGSPAIHSAGAACEVTQMDCHEDHICHPALLDAGLSCLNRRSGIDRTGMKPTRFVSLESIWFDCRLSKLARIQFYESEGSSAMLLFQDDGRFAASVAGIRSAEEQDLGRHTSVALSTVRTRSKLVVQESFKREETTKEDTLREIVNIVRDILQCDEIDPEETFFDAGIDSLTSLQLRATLQDKLKMQLPGTLVNDYPTAMALCEMIANSKQYKAIYLPPLHDTDCEDVRQIPPCLPRWYQVLMWPSKKLFEWKSSVHFPLRDGVYRVQPLRTATGPERYVACSTVDINVAWTRMRSTYFFKGGISDAKLIESLSPVLDAFPSLTSKLVERKGDLYFEYGGSNAHVEVRTGTAFKWTPQDYIGMVIPGIWRLSIAVWLWQFLYSNIGVALFLAWRAYTSLFGSPLMRIRITHIVKERDVSKSFWSPFKRVAESPLNEEEDIVGTYLTVDWMHSVADGGTMGRFMSLWAMAFRNEPLLVSHPGPLNALSTNQKEVFTRLWLNESPVPRLYRPLGGVGLNYIRFLLPTTLVQAIQDNCLQPVRASDVVVAYMWLQQIHYARVAEKVVYPKVTFLEDLRGHMPELQPFAGNLIRFLPPLVPGTSADDHGEDERVIAEVADLIFNHRKMDHFDMSDLERTGKLPGIPCCWSALHDLIRRDSSPMIMVNDLLPFDAPIRFDDRHVGIVPAEASGWRPDIPILSDGIMDSFADIPNWQIWLTRGPDGVVVSLFSMP